MAVEVSHLRYVVAAAEHPSFEAALEALPWLANALSASHGMFRKVKRCA
ncbi:MULTISPECIES: hypothetical protein [unclassified Nitrobacter]|nr:MULTISPECIES: hypothetical protein [unclassified Nitrobacter]MBN9149528.1 hypothetical protein [Nitrobacter sp.]